MGNNPTIYFDPNGLTNWRALGSATISFVCGISETIVGAGASTTGVGSVVGAYLIVDGVSRTLLSVPKIYMAIVDDPDDPNDTPVDPNNIPTNLGALTGAIIDNTLNSGNKYQTMGGFTNDFVTFTVTGGNAQAIATYADKTANTVQITHAAISQLSVINYIGSYIPNNSTENVSSSLKNPNAHVEIGPINHCFDP